MSLSKKIFLNSIIILSLTLVLDPNKQLARARNFARENGLRKIFSALLVYRAPDHEGHLPQGISAQCPQTQVIGKNGADLEFDLRNYFFKNFPYDPLNGTSNDTGYSICLDENRIRLKAVNAELGKEIMLGE